MINQDQNESKLFSTRDIYLASTLVSLRFPLLGIDFQIEGVKPRPIGYFKFDDTPELRRTRLEYNQSALLAEPKLLFSTLQSLKGEVMNMFSNPNSSVPPQYQG